MLFAVMKRGKIKKGKNDLIRAEEGEDPFADMSSVGKSDTFSLNRSAGEGHRTQSVHSLLQKSILSGFYNLSAI